MRPATYSSCRCPPTHPGDRQASDPVTAGRRRLAGRGVCGAQWGCLDTALPPGWLVSAVIAQSSCCWTSRQSSLSRAWGVRGQAAEAAPAVPGEEPTGLLSPETPWTTHPRPDSHLWSRE